MRQMPSRTGVRYGATVVEAAVVISALIMLLLAIMEYGRFLMLKQVVDNATREGARITLAADGSDPTSYYYQTDSTIQQAVTNALGGLEVSLSGLSVQAYLADSSGNKIGSWTGAQDGQNIAVEVSATYTPLFPSLGFLPNSITIFSKCIMRSEGN